MKTSSEVRAQLTQIGIYSDEQIDSMVGDHILKGTVVDDESTGSTLDASALDAAGDELAAALAKGTTHAEPDGDEDGSWNDGDEDNEGEEGDEDYEDDDDDEGAVEEVAKAIVAAVEKRMAKGGSDGLLKAVGRVNYEMHAAMRGLISELQSDRRARTAVMERLERIEKSLGASPGFRAVTSTADVKIIRSPMDEAAPTKQGSVDRDGLKRFVEGELRKAYRSGDQAAIDTFSKAGKAIDFGDVSLADIAASVKFNS